jgi:hypothetical protein
MEKRDICLPGIGTTSIHSNPAGGNVLTAEYAGDPSCVQYYTPSTDVSRVTLAVDIRPVADGKCLPTRSCGVAVNNPRLKSHGQYLSSGLLFC